MAYLARNYARAREASAEREASEVAECTFAPRLVSGGGGAGGAAPRAAPPPPLPAGWEQFLGRRRAAEALRREAEERAARVFGVAAGANGRRSAAGGFTVAIDVELETARRQWR